MYLKYIFYFLWVFEYLLQTLKRSILPKSGAKKIFRPVPQPRTDARNVLLYYRLFLPLLDGRVVIACASSPSRKWRPNPSPRPTLS